LNGGDNTEDKSVTGKVDEAFDFNGADDFVEIADSSALSPTSAVSISAWVDFHSLGEVTGIVWKHGYNYLLEQGGNRIYFNVWDSDGDQSSVSFADADLDPGWNHIAATFDGQARIYLNGTLKDTGSTIDNIRDNGGNLFIGKRPDGIGDTYFDGLIDQVKIFNNALSQGEVDSLYSEGASVGLVGHWTLDDNAGNTTVVGCKYYFHITHYRTVT